MTIRVPVEGGELTALTTALAGGLTLLERWFRRWPRWAYWLRYTRQVALPAEVVEWVPGPLKPPQGRTALTALTLNLWHDWPRFRELRERLERVAHLVETHQVDLLFLQETPRLGRFWADAWLAERLNMDRVYLRANGFVRDGRGFAEGVALLSRYPLADPKGLILRGHLPFVHRAAVGAWVHTPWGRFWATSVHTSISPWRQRHQAAQLHAWVEEQAGPYPALIGGDFNAWESHPGIRLLRRHWLDLLRARHTTRPVRTFRFRLFGLKEVGWRVDYIFWRPGAGLDWEPLTVQVLRSAPFVSDHLPMLARLAPQSLAFHPPTHPRHAAQRDQGRMPTQPCLRRVGA